MIQMSIGGERSVVSVLGSSYWIMLTNFHFSKILYLLFYIAVYSLHLTTRLLKQSKLLVGRHHKISKEENKIYIFFLRKAKLYSMEMLSLTLNNFFPPLLLLCTNCTFIYLLRCWKTLLTSVSNSNLDSDSLFFQSMNQQFYGFPTKSFIYSSCMEGIKKKVHDIS
jgi:hypothetical protein